MPAGLSDYEPQAQVVKPAHHTIFGLSPISGRARRHHLKSRIVVLDQEGTLVSMFGERGTDDAQFSFPEGLAISSSDRLYVADRQNNRLQIWQLASPLPKVTPADVKRFGEALKKF